MKKNYDLNNIGKRLPYTVPDNFFETVEEDLIKKAKQVEPLNGGVGEMKKTTGIGSISFRVIISAAAAVIIFAVTCIQLYNNANRGYSTIEDAFCNLTNDDRSYLLELYSDDIFINTQNE